MMMKRKLLKLLPVLVTGLILATAVQAADVDQYNVKLVKTKAGLAEAANKVQLWSTSGVLLTSAANAAEAGHYDQAIELLQEAALHGELAVATAEREKKTWQSGVPK
jgi:hypothetical protein